MSERFSFGEEKVAAVGEVELAYQQMGDPDGEPMLMIMGLGAQMIYWPDGFCAMLAERGFHLTRFDNRDAGRSSQIVAPDAPSVIAAFGGDRGRIPYTLEDMAADAAGLLDLLGIERAHVVGASLGGMIAQTLSFRHPDRVLSLCSIMSNTGSPDSGQPHESAMAALMTPLPIDTREHFVEGFLAARRAIGSTGFEIDEDALRKLAERCFERGVHVDGTARQFLAIIASGNRTEALRGIEAPTVVIHGSVDPLIDVSGGRATAAAIPGAELLVIEGMGHDQPRGVWSQIVGAIVANAERARTAASGR